MKKLKGLSFFEELLEEPQNELVDKALDQGRVAIGYNCYVVPEPLISAGRLFPVWMRAPGIDDTPQADYYLSAVICSYAKALLESGFEGVQEFISALVFAPSCDHIRRSGQHYKLENVNSDNENFFVYMIDTPNKYKEANIQWMVDDMKNLAKKLNDVYDANINDDSLKKAIKDFNEFNVLLKSIGDMRKGGNPKLTGTEWHIINGATKIAPKEMLIEPLKKIKKEIEDRDLDIDNKERIMIVGSLIDNPEVINIIEEQGSIVVADRFCFGSLPGMEPIEENGDPYYNLASHYIKTCQCPRMMGSSKERIAYSEKLIEEYAVEGIIFETIKFCDLWGYEILAFIKEMKNRDMPIVRIEREYALTGVGQLRTRTQAFLESIRIKKGR